MNSGSFFRLDMESSKVVKGITFYEYMDVPDFSHGIDNLKHPIRVSITSDSVIFFIHYIEEYNNFSGEDEFSKPHHVEETILRLPFNSSNPEALSSIIKRIYTTTFPVSIYLKKILTNRYIKIYGNDDESEYKQLQEDQVNLDSYSSLCVWGLLSNKRIVISKKVEDNRTGDSNGNITDSATLYITKFLRKLLLDFMFDLMHSNVFESSKYCSQMREGLMNDFFFSSIVKKSEYYYYRRLIRTRFSIIRDDNNYILSSSSKKKELFDKATQIEEKLKYQNERVSNIINKYRLNKKTSFSIVNRLRSRLLFFCVKRKLKYKSDLCSIQEDITQHEITNQHLEPTKFYIKNLYAERLDDAESAWVETIMSPMAEKHFVFSPDWFEDKENQVKHDDYEFFLSDSWFVNPEEEMNRIVFPKKKDCVHYLNSYELSKFIGHKDNSSVLDRNTNISKWYYRRFDFKDAFRLHFFQGLNDALCISLLFITLILIFIPGIWSSPKIISLIPALISLICFVTSVGFVIKSARNQHIQRIDDVLACIRRRRESWRALRLCGLFLCIGSILFSFESCIWIVIIASFVCILLLIFKRNCRSGDILHLFLPRLVASITAAWVMLVIGNELVKEHLSLPTCLIISVIVFVFIRYEINKTLPNITHKSIILRSFELMLISFLIALVVGVFAIDVQDMTALSTDADGKDPIIWYFLSMEDSYKLRIFPSYLIRFSSLAMFIGVFIQMIFEEKNITEL